MYYISHTHTYTHAYTHSHTPTYTHTYAYTHAYIHLHTLLHIQMDSNVRREHHAMTSTVAGTMHCVQTLVKIAVNALVPVDTALLLNLIATVSV